MAWHRLLLSLALFAAIVAGCTCAGCGDGFFWSADLPSDLGDAELRALAVRACRNDACVQGRFDELDFGEPRRGADTWMLLSDPAAPDEPGAWFIISRAVDGSVGVTLQWSARGAFDGDRFLVEITDPSGALVAGLEEEAVDYHEYRANGPLDPALCRRASLRETSSDAGARFLDAR